MKYFDLHCDTATECYDKHRDVFSNDLNISLQKADEFERWVQVFAVWIRDSVRGEDAYRRFCEVRNYFVDQLNQYPEDVTVLKSGEDLGKSEKKTKGTAILAIEGGAALSGKMEHLYDVFRQGVRMITLTWNGKNELGDGCMEPDAGGLTSFGFDAVREMNRMGIVVDVSHLSEAGFRDVAKTSRAPFVASHSDSKALRNHRRNLTDDQFREIAKGGGLVGLNYYRDFLGGRENRDEILNHAEHFLELGGERTLALGSDFDGCELADGIDGMEDMNQLYDAMCGRFGRALADDIFFNNANRFFLKNLK